MISCFFRNEAPIPTHFFIILTSCGNSTFSPVNCEGPLQAMSFILPHRPDHTESCAVSSHHQHISYSLLHNLLTDPTLEKMTKAPNYRRIFIYFFLFVFRMGRTWRGWRSGCSFTQGESETSSCWPDSASTTTGYQWRRRYSSRRIYSLLKETLPNDVLMSKGSHIGLHDRPQSTWTQ